ncbi:hypothetical protein SMD44_06942 [Streptomyces alboflavus]|uniref:Uncharacterized protein n=1 Tax=Streptomyces alboflavus TaxID=67267 RepID=A0A1Z1WM00_9ACTN|nr:hypothetical protein SMD44_06942 [Streptomyces alboflavus]
MTRTRTRRDCPVIHCLRSAVIISHASREPRATPTASAFAANGTAVPSACMGVCACEVEPARMRAKRKTGEMMPSL